MPIYDDHFFTPPAPLARVTLRNSGDGKTVSDVPMLIDSGADVTLIPQQSVTLLGALIEADTSYEVMGFDGRKSTAQVVSLDLIFLKHGQTVKIETFKQRRHPPTRFARSVARSTLRVPSSSLAQESSRVSAERKRVNAPCLAEARSAADKTRGAKNALTKDGSVKDCTKRGAFFELP